MLPIYRNKRSFLVHPQILANCLRKRQCSSKRRAHTNTAVDVQGGQSESILWRISVCANVYGKSPYYFFIGQKAGGESVGLSGDDVA